MVLSKAQESEMKNLCKEMVKELLSDKEFMESFSDKIISVVTKKLISETDKFKKQLNTIEGKLNKIQGECSSLKQENIDLKNKLDNMMQSSSLADVQGETVVTKLDDLEQRSLLQQLRIFGVPEEKDENLKDVIIQLFDETLGITLTGFEFLYRIGTNKNTKKPRPISVKFLNMVDRNNIFFNKKKLKGLKISIVEELTKARYQLLQAAKDKFRRENVWTRDGKIYMKIKGKKYQMKTIGDLATF